MTWVFVKVARVTFLEVPGTSKGYHLKAVKIRERKLSKNEVWEMHDHRAGNEMKTSKMTTLLMMINNRKQLSLDITNASTPDAKRVVLSFRPDQSTFPKGTFKIREYSHVNPEISFTSLSVKDAKKT